MLQSISGVNVHIRPSIQGILHIVLVGIVFNVRYSLDLGCIPPASTKFSNVSISIFTSGRYSP